MRFFLFLLIIAAIAFADDHDDGVLSPDSGGVDTASIVHNDDDANISYDEDAVVGTTDTTDTAIELPAAQDTTALPLANDVSADTIVPPPEIDRQNRQEEIAGTFLGFNAGLSIGSIPLFRLWQKSLPEKIEHLGLNADFGNNLSPGDREFLKYRVTENPDQFNFVMPFGVSLHRVDRNSSISLGVSFFISSRQFQSELFIDDSATQLRRIDMYETMRFSSLTIEAAYQRAVPPEYFSIDGSQTTYLSIGAGISPLNFFSRDGDFKMSAPEDDPRMNAIADSARARFSDLSANGIAITWRAGISTLRNNPRGGGIELGLFYSGSYSAGFYNGDTNVTNGHIHAEGNDANKALAFISNRVEFKITFLRSLNKKARTNDDGAAAGEHTADNTENAEKESDDE